MVHKAISLSRRDFLKLIGIGGTTFIVLLFFSWSKFISKPSVATPNETTVSDESIKMTVYIDPDFPSNGMGTFEEPFNSWVSVIWAAGNMYLQKAGTTSRPTDGVGNDQLNAIRIKASGTETARITIGSYDPATGNPTTAKAYVKGNLGGNTINGVNTDASHTHITIQDLDISQVGNGTSGRGITKITPSDTFSTHWIVQRCDVHDIVDNGPGGVDIDGISISGADNITRDCNVYNIPDDAFVVRGERNEIANCKVWNINTNGKNKADCIHAANGLSGLYIHDNNLDSSNGRGKQSIIVGGTTPATGYGCIIENNVLIGGDDVQQNIVTNMAGGNILHNTLVNGTTGIRITEGADGAKIIGNLIINKSGIGNTWRGIYLEDSTVTVANNTIINTMGQIDTQTGIYAEIGDVDHTIQNNIVIGFYRGIRIDSVGGQTEDYNCVYNCTLPIQNTAGTTIVKGTNTITTDPILTSDYKPTSSTPNGIFLEHYTDRNGMQYHDPPTMGAYQYLSEIDAK